MAALKHQLYCMFACAYPSKSSPFTLILPLLFSEWNLPYGVRRGAGSQGQAGTSHCQGPRASIWTLCQPAGPHQTEGSQTYSYISKQNNVTFRSLIYQYVIKDVLNSRINTPIKLRFMSFLKQRFHHYAIAADTGKCISCSVPTQLLYFSSC